MVGQVALGADLGGVHGFPSALTSLVGRLGAVDEVAGLLDECRLVTVTGPGGVGKTRLAAEVARRVAGRFADGVWLAELAGVADPALVPTVLAGVLGLVLPPGEPLAAVLAQRQMLLVLDNCEHLVAAVAEVSRDLLLAADDVRILATSREPLGVPGEARYRLPPLELPAPDDPRGVPRPDAVTLFADRARRADPHFTLDVESGRLVAQIVTRLDGMPLAIELAAARVEALGVAQLADRLDDRFALLAGTDRLAVSRQQSLAAAADWSYQLLGESEQRVFRALSAFPGPFTLAAAEVVAGDDTGPLVLHLVDCSLLVPPHPGADGQARYTMLETLRAFGAQRLAEAGEQDAAAAAVCAHAVQVAEHAAACLSTTAGELAGIRLLEAEDTTLRGCLGWALEHDRDTALRLAIALAPWWFLRGQWASGYRLLAAAAANAAENDQQWATAQFWLGLLTAGSDVPASLGHLTAVRDALAGQPPEHLLGRALAWRAGCVANLGRVREAASEASCALSMARELGDPTGEVFALYWLGAAALYGGNTQGQVACYRQAQQIDRAVIPGWIARQLTIHLADALDAIGEAVEARHYCAEALALARSAGALYDQGDCLLSMAWLDLRAGQLAEARAHLREALEIYARTGAGLLLLNCLRACADLCAETRSWREVITLSAALDAVNLASFKDSGDDLSPLEERVRGHVQKAAQALGPEQVQTEHERGAAMTPAAAAAYALLLVTEEAGRRAAGPGVAQLSARERELVTLVAQGATNAQIADQLFISVRTVGSHLDRIRDKTGCRRRADLTRLAVREGLI